MIAFGAPSASAGLFGTAVATMGMLSTVGVEGVFWVFFSCFFFGCFFFLIFLDEILECFVLFFNVLLFFFWIFLRLFRFVLLFLFFF